MSHHTITAARRRARRPDAVSDLGILIDGVQTEVFNCMRYRFPHPRHLWKGGHEYYTCRGNPLPTPAPTDARKPERRAHSCDSRFFCRRCAVVWCEHEPHDCEAGEA